MMIDNKVKRVSPLSSAAMDKNCRPRMANGERVMFIRRKVFGPQRLVQPELTGADGGVFEGEDHYTKRKRTEESEEFSNIKTTSAPSSSSTSPENKLVENEMESDVYVDEEDKVRENYRSVTSRSHGSISVIGRRREMEDAVAIQLGFLKSGSEMYDFFGVYDGHGGSRVAQACRERLYRLVAEVVKGEENDHGEDGAIEWEKVMAASFSRMDEEVEIGGSSVALMGSTAVVAVVEKEVVVVANCGDSRAVLSRDGVAIALSDDHKPDRPDERERIEGSGGKVINRNGQRVLGVLGTSRAIGDYYLKPFVISEPEVKTVQRTDKDEFLILACDGLWDVISNDFACQVVRECLYDQVPTNSMDSMNTESDQDRCGLAMKAASVLAQLAIARGTGDNVSVIVVELKKLPCSNAS